MTRLSDRRYCGMLTLFGDSLV